MTTKELQEKLNQSNEKVEKRINTLSKLCKRQNVNVTDVLNNYYSEVKENYEPYFLTKEQRELIIKDLNLDEDTAYEVKENLYKLYELERVRENWKVKLQKEINKDNIEKIPVIWDFLTEWENKALDWYRKNCKEYFELRKNEEQAVEEYKNSESYKLSLERWKAYHKYSGEYIITEEFLSRYYSQIDSFTKIITHTKRDYNNGGILVDYQIDEVKLTSEVAKEKLNKYLDLINRVTKLIGEIKDANNLSIGNQNGELNGIIIGEKGKIRIETISAGGYNIQRFHYRVLIHRVKDSL